MSHSSDKWDAGFKAGVEAAANATKTITPAKNWDGWTADEGWELARGECEDAIRALPPSAPPSDATGGGDVRVSSIMGRDLICKCGAGAVDVAPDYYIDERTAVSWTCASGHKQISGWRPGTEPPQPAKEE